MIAKTPLAGLTAVGLLLSPVPAMVSPAVYAKPATLELDAGGAQVKVGASVWTNIYTRLCGPNSRFTTKLTIDASADLLLYFPGTSVYASATSNVVGVIVI